MNCELETLVETLQRDGAAILPGYLEEIADEIEPGIWDFLEGITANWETPIDRNNEKTWNEFYNLYPKHGMLLQQWQAGHANICWDIRQNMKVLNVFSTIWNCEIEDLLVSFDGLSMHLPPEKTKRRFNQKEWLHCDQSFRDSNFKCVQSWVNGSETNENDATLMFLKGSHLLHSEFAKKLDKPTAADWYKFTDSELELYKECEKVRVACPKGSLVLWDSRTVHCGAEPLRRTEPRIRSVIYLCYLPRSHATEANLRKKIKAFEDQRTTSHWPNKPKLFPLKPRTYGNPVPVCLPVQRKEIKLKFLAGYSNSN